MRPIHPFGELLSRLRARQHGLTQARLAELAGYDPAVIARMAQGHKDLTGTQARERVLRVIQALDAAGVLNGVAEANALLEAAAMPPLFAGNYVEAELMQQLAIHRRADGDVSLPITPRHNLPAQLTSFIGREQEMAQMKQLLTGSPITDLRTQTRSTARLVTLTGPGGVGKTRLALEVAAAMTTDFADGVWWVPLASLQDASLVAQTLIDTLQLNRQPDAASLGVLVHYLKNRRLLLVLDNCEHLVDACAELVAHLMRTCPNLRILATSREALQVPGELTLRVPPLTAPQPAVVEATFLADKNKVMDFDAVRLFVERAQAMRPDFDLTLANATAVVYVCDRLDGIPLALELAAALMQVLSVEEIAARIDNRFALLKGGYRAVTPRHQALSNAVDWSYELLSPAERILLARLAVFAGSWDAATAERVCADPTGELKREEVLPALRQLVNKSLVVIDQDDAASTRYRLLKTIHEYATEKLHERQETQMMKDKHLNDLVDFAEAVDARLNTSDHISAREQLMTQRDELRAALAHAEASGNAEALLRLTAALQSSWRGDSRAEGTQWMNRALVAGSDAPARLRLKVLFAWAWTYPDEAAHFARHAPLVEACLEECRAAQDQIGVAQALTLLSDIARTVNNDFAQARAYLEEAWQIFKTSHDRRAIAIVRHKMSVVLKQLDGAAAEAWMQESIDLYRASGDDVYLAASLADLAWQIEARNPAAAQLIDLWHQSVAAAQEFGDVGLHSEFLLNLGNAELAAENRSSAADHLAQALQMACAMDSKVGMYWSLKSLCQVDRVRAESILKGYLVSKQQAGDRRGIDAGTYFLGIILQEVPDDFEQARQLFE